jgi:hydroxymethylpyrimidine pyrophosphatase-like HAD family hydrolase
MKYVIDLDGTLCEERSTFEKCLAAPFQSAIDKVNRLHDEGHFIIIYTARGWAEFKATEDWLRKHDVRYHVLMCGKPHYDVWVDDRACNAKDWQ